MWDMRVRILASKQDSAGCIETAAKWDALGRTDANSLYLSACLRSVCAVVIRESENSASADARVAEQIDLAMARLRKAVSAGYTNVEHMKSNDDLDILRNRADFKNLLAEMSASIH
jgi:hypothetical protein